ncbi:MAG: TonB-dependent receptor plug domain-containing protein, partial [Telluria sp.]
MNFPVASRRAPALKPLALVSALSLSLASAAACAQSPDQSMPSVRITGARFASDPALMPIGATVITADDIARAGVSDLNQAIRKIGGVYGRQSLDASPDFGLDLRGFGANSGQNLV